jgi:uncharacterized protein YndB with AHSA1/START domain
MKKTISVNLDVASPPATVFATITDLPGYNTWLPKSMAFKGTTEVSETPIKTGTTYVEHSPAGTRYGEVLELDEAAHRVIFHQPMKLRPNFLGLEMDIIVDMTVKAKKDGGSTLLREVRLDLPAAFAVVSGPVLKQFRDESLRTMQRLKEFLEK